MAVVIIMIPEPIDVAPSEENGNVPLDAPSEDTPEVKEEDPTEETPKVEGEEAEEAVEDPVDPPVAEELYELSDGRKVTGPELKDLHINLNSEFTRKSQELADLKPKYLPEAPKDNPYADPDYTPENYEEIIKATEARVLATVARGEQDRIQAQTDAENAVVGQLDEIKKIDSSLDENKLFQHANKYGFRDLKQAHQNMQDMSAVVKTTQKDTAKNIAKRADPVSKAPGGSTGSALDPAGFENATAYLRSLT